MFEVYRETGYSFLKSWMSSTLQAAVPEYHRLVNYEQHTFISLSSGGSTLMTLSLPKVPTFKYHPIGH